MMTAAQLREARKARLAAAAKNVKKQASDTDELDSLLADLDETLAGDEQVCGKCGEPHTGAGCSTMAQDEELGMDDLLNEELPLDEEAAVDYHPSSQKPTQLTPERDSGLSHYYGPIPDAGFAYGSAMLDLVAAAALADGIEVVAEDGPPGKMERAKQFVKEKGQAAGVKFREVWDKMSVALKKRIEQIRAAMEQLKGKVGPKIQAAREKLSVALGKARKALSELWQKMKKRFQKKAPLQLTGAFKELYQMLNDKTITAGTVKIADALASANVIEAEFTKLGKDLLTAAHWTEQDVRTAKLEIMAPKVEAQLIQPLVAASSLKDVTQSDINMTLYNAETENPHWDINVKGFPVAACFLKDQQGHDEIRAIFVTPDYANGVREAMAKLGVDDVLSEIKAKRYAAVVDGSEQSKTIEARINSEMQASFEQAQKEADEQFLHCMSVSLAGFQKNFWPARNPMKEAFWNEMKKAGVHDPARTIEAAFAEGGNPFFEAAVSKARELMQMEPQALVQIAQAIGQCEVQLPTAADEVTAAVNENFEVEDMRTRMARTSVGFTAMGEAQPTGTTVRERVRAGLRLNDPRLR